MKTLVFRREIQHRQCLTANRNPLCSNCHTPGHNKDIKRRHEEEKRSSRKQNLTTQGKIWPPVSTLTTKFPTDLISRKKSAAKVPKWLLVVSESYCKCATAKFLRNPNCSSFSGHKKLSIILHESKGILIILLTVQGKGVLIKQGEDTSIASGHINDDTLTCND